MGHEWLEKLKPDELKILCKNRGIGTDKTTHKELAAAILKCGVDEFDASEDCESLPRETLKLELKIRNVPIPKSVSTQSLIELLEEHNETKLSKKMVQSLDITELRKLCQRRDIETKSIHSSRKKELLELLTEYGEEYPDPEYNENMTSGTLKAELKGRGLAVSGLKKAQMLAVLRSDISFEEQRLEQFLKTSRYEEMIGRTQETLERFIDFMLDNAEEIKKETKKRGGAKEAKKQSSEWEQIRKVLNAANDNIIETKILIECYCGPDISMNRREESKELEEDDEDEAYRNVYVVFDEDEEKVLKQDASIALGVFSDESEAEAFCREQNPRDVDASIQQIRLNDPSGAEPLW